MMSSQEKELDILNSKAESIEIDLKMFDSNFEISRDVNCEIKVETAFSVKEELPDSDFLPKCIKNIKMENAGIQSDFYAKDIKAKNSLCNNGQIKKANCCMICGRTFKQNSKLKGM